MNPRRRQRLLFLLSALLTVVLAVACQAVTEIEIEPEARPGTTATAELPEAEPTAADDSAAEDSARPLSIPGAEPDTTTPAGVVDAFYTWYLDPERAGEFDDSPYLSRRRVAAVRQAMEEGFLGADPFLLAQDTPAAIRVEEVAVEAERAQVVLHQYWNMDTEEGTPWDLTLDLIREQGSWKIDGIQRGSPLSPEGVVQLFYNWYFNYGEPDHSLGNACYALASAGNPLADRAYRESPFLAQAFIDRVEALLAEQEGAVAYDPFLRARNHPRGFYVVTHEMEVKGAEASVPVQLAYGREQIIIEVEVTNEDGKWRIVEVQGELPDEATAASQVVALFADVYFGQWYEYANANDLSHTGEVDVSGFLAQMGDFYAASPFLSTAFGAAARESVAGGKADRDPFFLATGVPAMIEIEEAWADGDRAEVRVVQRWDGGHETRPLTVTLERKEGRWLISGVVPISGEAVAVDPRAEMHPADVVRAFFAGYLAQGGYAGGAHRENEYLAPAYVEVVENDASHYASLGIPVAQVDPILHSTAKALDEGLRVEVGAVTVDEERHMALAQADRVYGNGTSLPLTVMLMRDWDNRWTIQEVHAVDLARMPATGEDLPETYWLQTYVAALYDWALAYGAQPEKVQDLPDLMRFGMDAEGGITFCEPSWPLGFVVEAAFIEPDTGQGSQRASVVLRTTSEHTLLTLELEKRDWLWIIVDQQCGDTPAGRARAFYTAYLDIHDNRLQERAYARGDYLTADLIMSVDDAVEGAPGKMPESGDPFTLAQEAVQWFRVAPGPTTNSALVTLVYGGGKEQTLHLTFVLVDGRWLLSNVERSG